MKRFAVILLMGLIVGCYSEKKATSQFNKAVLSYPHIPLDYCAAKFPDKPDSVIIKTDTLVEIATMDSLVYDTLLLKHDSLLMRTIVKTKIVTVRKDSIIYRGPNLAEEKRLQLLVNDCQTNSNAILKSNQDKDLIIAEWKGKAKKRWLWIALLIGGAAAYTAFKIFKPKLPFKI
jgi:hypothetical protein